MSGSSPRDGWMPLLAATPCKEMELASSPRHKGQSGFTTTQEAALLLVMENESDDNLINHGHHSFLGANFVFKTRQNFFLLIIHIVFRQL